MIREQQSSSSIFDAALLGATHSTAGNARDSVYGVLGLAPGGIAPDYNKSVYEVYLEAIVHGDEPRRNLSKCLERLPSWLLDFSTLHQLPGAMCIDNRPELRLLLGTMEIQPPRIIEKVVLCIQGAVCSRVNLVKQYDLGLTRKAVIEILYKLCVEYLAEFVHVEAPSDIISGGWAGIRMTTVSWCFFTLLLTGEKELEDADRAKELWRLGLPPRLAPLSKVLMDYFEDSDKGFPDPEAPAEFPLGSEYGCTFREFMDSMYACSRRTLFQTDQGQLGLGPRHLRQGDLVCAVDRLTLPILLREVERPGILLGACWNLLRLGVI
ncbi:hypothetical protein F4818DRAFT_454036 [Hypoxylon cercidicola]|nr:hypothetical protein F4818DRAFT_454036 [Hypoxylon cercidicola]